MHHPDAHAGIVGCPAAHASFTQLSPDRRLCDLFPLPCSYIKGVSSDVEYLNSRDATIMGSRNGHAPIYRW